MQSHELSIFDDVTCVVADPLRFKLRLGIGEDAYTSLRIKKSLVELWDVGGMAATGAAVAASPIVASTFFASTGGFLSALGLGAAAATPIGWVAAAAVVSGGAYMGVTRLARGYVGSRVDVIPHFLNTPMDLLAASLFDLIAALASRIAAIDGKIEQAETNAIKHHFVGEWGLDANYVDKALAIIIQGVGAARVKDLAAALASFQDENPDCNAQAMQTELMTFLKHVCEADGQLDEREELALDAVARIFEDANAFSLPNTGRAVAGWVKEAADAAAETIGNKLPGRTRAVDK